jgi:hypothetical protein
VKISKKLGIPEIQEFRAEFSPKIKKRLKRRIQTKLKANNLN